MSNNDKMEQYHAAYAAMQAARQELLAATKAAWPVGMQVISNKFNTGPIACTVAGHCDWSNDVGSLRLRNNRTGKTHQAWPYACHGGVWGVVSAQPCDVANEADLWRCTVCGRIGTVGRCCGEDTRNPVRAPNDGIERPGTGPLE